MNFSKGYVQVYTGNGKGKTTAALGQALRAAGHGMKTYIGQFLKGMSYGELNSIQNLSPLITIEQFGRKGFIHVTENPDQEDIQRAQDGLARCRKAMGSGNYQIVVLDEIHVAFHFQLLGEEEIQKFLDQKPENVEIILTGRYAPQSILQRADLVTEMKEVKHYYQKKVGCRDGIER